MDGEDAQARLVTVRRGGSATTCWEVAHAPAGAHLRGLLGCYAGYAERATGPVARREVPVPRVMVIIGLGEPITVRPGPDPNHARRVPAFAAGLTCGPTWVDHAGSQRCVELALTPLGAYQLLGLPMSELTGRVVDLTDLWGRRAAVLTDQLAAAPDWATRFALLDDALAGRCGRAPDPEVTGSWDRLARARGGVAIGDLAGDAGWSRGRLARRFREQVGLSPKRTASVLRFARAVRLVADPADHPLAAVAQRCGYYDQAHLNREFRALAGCTPGAYRAARLEPALVGVGARSARHDPVTGR